MKKKPKKYRPRFSLDEIKQFLDWYDGEFTGAVKLHRKLLRIKNKMTRGLN